MKEHHLATCSSTLENGVDFALATVLPRLFDLLRLCTGLKVSAEEGEM